MHFLDNYFHLCDDEVLVKGAKYSLLIDLNNECVYRPNEYAMQIIEMGERGLKISDVLNELKSKLDVNGILIFIEELYNQGMICISQSPKKHENLLSSPLLEFLWIEVTSACNQRCIHCYADVSPKEIEVLPFSQIEKIIYDASNVGCKAVQFTGGECTLRDDLPDLIKLAKYRDFDFIEVFTNGTLLNESMIKFFADEEIHVAVSIHGCTAKTHDKITGLHGSFERSLNNIKLLIDNGIPTRCSTIALKQNEDELDEIGRFLSQLGVVTKIRDIVRPCGRGMALDNWPETYGLKSIQSKPFFEATHECYDRNSRGNYCWFGKVAVTSSGDVIPCPFARNQVVGNVTKHNLTEIIYGEKLQHLWSLTHDRIEVCKDCEYRFLCTDCRPLAYGITGNTLSKSPICTYDPYTGEWMNAKEALIFQK